MTAIFYDYDKFAVLNQPDLNQLKKAAVQSPLRRSRFCMHKNYDDFVQEMIIVFCRDSVVPIHRHVNKSESFHIIEGKIEIVFFDDNRNIINKIKLGTFQSGFPFYFRQATNEWHSVNPLSEFVILHETTTGPFNKKETEYLQ